jgi:hypothetical protein
LGIITLGRRLRASALARCLAAATGLLGIADLKRKRAEQSNGYGGNDEGSENLGL